MLGRERHHDVGILRSYWSRIAIRKINPAIRQTDVVDDPCKFLRWDLLTDLVLHVVAQRSGFFNSCSSLGAQVQREFTAIDRWEEVLSQPWQQSERNEACEQKCRDENATMINECFEQPAICATNTFKSTLERALKARERVPAGFMRTAFGTPLEQVLGERGDERSRKQVRSQHRKYNRLSQRHKEVPRDTGEQEHRHKDDANAQG